MSFLKPTTKTPLDEAIDEVLLSMRMYSPDTDEYAKMLTQLERLYKLRSPKKESKSVSPDVLVNAIASVTGIGMILGFEKAHVVTSKALSFVSKPRI